MRVAVIFVLLFATVLCRPARKVSVSSSESSEEVVRRPAAQPIRKQVAVVPRARAAPVQNIVAAAAASSDESDSSDEDQAAVEATAEVTSDVSATVSSDTTSVSSKDSEDSDDDDDDDDDDETEESETEEDESSDSSESGESSTVVPSTLTPMIITEEPLPETTEAPIEPTIVTDEEAARGDSLGGYPSDYKTIIYVEDKSYHKVPSPYKSYEYMNTGKKMAHDMTDGNEVDKSLHVYKAIHVHSDLLEEDTSTPEVESQGLDASSGTSQDSLPEEDSASASDATTSESESTSTPEEEEEEEESASTASDSASASQEAEDEESQSSEEATATPGAADDDSDESESSESDSDEEGAGPDTTSDAPVVITAK
ncbi:uncharacterized protein LOC109996490 isoform X2 [Xyrichtys novacula]|uniref:Uncharacterized protein LOC109996490 isoform X2 n=1 Tax=Xyrichtys novacula TaxID=13765 RepID=A0AAV1GDJ5_XYRNO|nr:uncharacterized protein LOC109996490 isoform X2 [Xyrichtys novacula]